MNRRGRITGALLGAMILTASPLSADPPKALTLPNYSEKSIVLPVKLSWPIDAANLPESHRDKVIKVVQSPTISALAKAEEFVANPSVYVWLLDHPDRVSLAWRRLGVPAVEIKNVDSGFTWKDGQGSELNWTVVTANADGRIWYAEGKAKAGALFPLVPVKAVAVLRHKQTTDAQGKIVLKHQVELFLQTDSRAASLVTRLLGPAGPRMAEQGADQVLLYFSGIADYLAKRPEKGPDLLVEKKEGR